MREAEVVQDAGPPDPSRPEAPPSASGPPVVVRGTGGVDVFLNVRSLQDNPYPQLWAHAVEQSGATVHDLGFRPLLTHRRAPGARRGWVDLQWPEWALSGTRAQALRGLVRWFGVLGLARALGVRVLLTVHNVQGHDAHHPRLESAMWRGLVRLATHLHTFTASGADEFVERWPAARHLERVVVPHGDYGDVAGAVPAQAEARAELGLPEQARVLLTFGRLKAYKGLEALLGAFADRGDRDVRLLVRGQPDDEQTASTLDRAAQDDANVDVVPRFLTQEELTAAIAAADLVVLPYSRVTNSGSALMALTVGTAVLLPRTPVFEELQARVGGDWVHLFDAPLGADDLDRASAVRPAGRPDLAWCSWDAVSAGLRRLWTAA